MTTTKRNRRITCAECGLPSYFLISGEMPDDLFADLNRQLVDAGWLIGSWPTCCCPECANETIPESKP